MAVYDQQGSGRSELTRQTLDCLLETVDFSKHRLFVIDNGSCCQTQEVISDFMIKYINHGLPPDNFNYIRLNENIGTAKAVNKGWVQRNPGEFVIKIDNDVIIHSKNWIEELEEVFRRDPRVGICGLKRKDLIETTTNPDQNFRSELIQLPHVPGERWVVVEKAKGIMGTCQMVNHKLIDKIGYLYQPTIYGFDDSFFSARSELAGFYNCFLPHIDIDHIDPGGTDYTNWKAAHAGEIMGQAQGIMQEYLSGRRHIYEKP